MSEKKTNRLFSVLVGVPALLALAYLLLFVPHEVMGHLITVFLTVLACIAGFAAILAMANFYLNGPGWSREIDAVGSQFVGADGKWDFSGDTDTGNYGTPRNARDGYREGTNNDPQGWEAVEYDADGDNFTLTPAGPDGPNRQDVGLEIESNDPVDQRAI